MGARKRTAADQRKEENKNRAMAVLHNCPTSPRKMRLVVDMIRGVDVNRALDILRFSTKEPSQKVEKLLLSAIANWQKKNEEVRVEKSNLYVKEVFVDGGRQLKRLRTAPQGRGYRIRKRSNHVTIILDSRVNSQEQVESKTN
ncbi:MAG: 50S ribosomal protein L22 [Bacteroidales bacterium]|nr:50S ribosomal protein L22 [Bacteroidales bacterium]